MKQCESISFFAVVRNENERVFSSTFYDVILAENKQLCFNEARYLICPFDVESDGARSPSHASSVLQPPHFLSLLAASRERKANERRLSLLLFFVVVVKSEQQPVDLAAIFISLT